MKKNKSKAPKLTFSHDLHVIREDMPKLSFSETIKVIRKALAVSLKTKTPLSFTVALIGFAFAFLPALISSVLKLFTDEIQTMSTGGAYEMRYVLMLFGALFLPLLTGIAVLFGWFPSARPGAWVLFLAIALAVFAAMTAGFEMYFRVAGRRYDGLLGQYRKEHEGESAS